MKCAMRDHVADVKYPLALRAGGRVGRRFSFNCSQFLILVVEQPGQGQKYDEAGKDSQPAPGRPEPTVEEDRSWQGANDANDDQNGEGQQSEPGLGRFETARTDMPAGWGLKITRPGKRECMVAIRAFHKSRGAVCAGSNFGHPQGPIG